MPMFAIEKGQQECFGYRNALILGRFFRAYRCDVTRLTYCYWAFLEDIEDGLP
jgi:hypothetical protein